MMTGCHSGKISIDNETLAQEELIRLNVKYGTQSPNGYYRCEICGGYHLTSKSRDTTFIDSPEAQDRIRKGRMGSEWMDL